MHGKTSAPIIHLVKCLQRPELHFGVLGCTKPLETYLNDVLLRLHIRQEFLCSALMGEIAIEAISTL